MVNKSNFFIFLSLAFLIGCAATGEKYTSSQVNLLNGKSEIVIYRENKLGASGSDFCVNIEDEPFGILKNGGYLKTTLEPGMHKISLPFSDELEIELEVKEGETKYVELTIGLSNMFVLQLGTIASISMSWDMSLVNTPVDYSLEKLKKIRESEYSNSCNT